MKQFQGSFSCKSVFHLSREALPDRRNRQTMDFKLPHDVVCACAKRDEPPSRRRPFRVFLFKILYCQ